MTIYERYRRLAYFHALLTYRKREKDFQSMKTLMHASTQNSFITARMSDEKRCELQTIA